MTSLQVPGFAELFVTNVLNGTVAAGGSVVDQGTVVRLVVALPKGSAPQLLQGSVIGTGFSEQLNSSALVLGPTGVALGYDGTLYVADTVNSRIAAIPFAPFRFWPVGGGGYTVTSGGGLEQPLGLMLAPNGDLIAANGGNGNAVEVTPTGDQVANVEMDPLNSGGDLFGLTLTPSHKGILFVDDGNNTLERFSP
jgi:sugar lactone lactonase YvrE